MLFENSESRLKLRAYRVKLMSEWNPPDVSIGMIERAWHWTDQAQVSFWDGLIVAAAERTRCSFLLSEDFQAGKNSAPSRF
jgi:predicted nucleic acid-binding protein